MSRRKHTSNQDSPSETVTTIAEPPAESVTAVTESESVEPNATGQTFAEAVGQKKWVAAPDPFGIATDNLAGVRLFESKNDRQMAIKFGEGRPEDKPSQAVIDRMKEAGYRWNPTDRIWAYPVGPHSALSTRIDAEKLYQEVRQTIRKEKGIEESMEIPF